MPLPSALPCSDVSRNSLTGSLPPEWEALGSLVTLDASSNYLSGGMPDAWKALASVQQLRLASNNLVVRWDGGSSPHLFGAGRIKQSLAVKQTQLVLCVLHLSSLMTALCLPFCPQQGPIPASWARLPSLTLLDLGSNVGVCGGQPTWHDGTQAVLDATNVAQSCIMVGTSGVLAGILLGKLPRQGAVGAEGGRVLDDQVRRSCGPRLHAKT